MHSYFANLYEVECASQHYHRTLENIGIWDISLLVSLAVCSIGKKDAIVGEVFGWGVGLNMEE